MPQRTIFFGGVHGVGKSTLLAQQESDSAWRHLKASTLISQARDGRRNWDETKRVSDQRLNQKLLIESLNLYVGAGEFILLDGHYSLRNDRNQIENIDVDTFRAIGPEKLVICTCHPQVVSDRLTARGTAGWSAAEIEEMQTHELDHARTVSEMIGIKLVIVETDSFSSAEKATRDLIK